MRAALLIGLILVCTLQADDEARAKAIANQKKAANEAWTSMEVGTPVQFESKHLLIFAPEARKDRLKAMAGVMEKYHDAALKVTGLEEKDAYPGKITVYIFPEKQNIPTFARRIEKRRPMSGETVT